MARVLHMARVLQMKCAQGHVLNTYLPADVPEEEAKIMCPWCVKAAVKLMPGYQQAMVKQAAGVVSMTVTASATVSDPMDDQMEGDGPPNPRDKQR